MLPVRALLVSLWLVESMYCPYFVVYSAEKDTHDVYREVVGLAGRWSSICLSLRLLPCDQSAIAVAHPGNPHDCLQAVIVNWLRKGYDYQKYGCPTWRMLVEAVGDPAGGSDCALAEIIAKKYPGIQLQCVHKSFVINHFSCIL